LVGALVFFIALVIIALRWQYLLRAIQPVPLGSLVSLVSIGYMGNNVYPLRSGEALRIYLLKRNHGVPMIRATTTVLVERVFDGIILLTYVIVPLVFIDTASQDIRRVALVAAPVFVSAMAIFLILATRPQLLRGVIHRIRRWLPDRLGAPVGQLGEEIIAGLEGLRRPADLLGTVLSSYATWGVQGIVFWIVALGFDMDVSFGTMLLVVGTVNLAGLIPASPGQIGVFEFFVRSVLVGAGITEQTALAYALVVHMVIWLPVTLLGFILLIRQGLGWNAITHARQLETTASIQQESRT
jgi:glycosyltransferase 2 family protein